MALINIKESFRDGFNGRLLGKNGEITIGSKAGDMAPYEMLLGALGSCFYATFLEVCRIEGIAFGDFDIDIEGEKKIDLPTTLVRVDMKIRIGGVEDQDLINRALKYAADSCSIYVTIGKVAKMNYEVTYI